MIIDFHAHVYPDAIAARAAQSIARFYDYPVPNGGTLAHLLKLGDEAGVERFVIHSVATTPTQPGRINDFIAQCVAQHPDRLTGLASMHPDTPDMREQLERALAAGLKGVKIHPDIQRVEVDDPRLYRMYEMLEGRAILLTHAGDLRYDFSNPGRMARVARDFPHLTMICAHLGGWSCWPSAVEMLADTGVYVDCSSSLFALTPAQARDIIRRYGAQRVLFGTDYPMGTPSIELERLDALELDEREMELILHKNAERLLGL